MTSAATAEELVRPVTDTSESPRLRIFLLSFAVLFFELLCIRWIPAHVQDHRRPLFGPDRTEQGFSGKDGETDSGGLVEQPPEGTADGA